MNNLKTLLSYLLTHIPSNIASVSSRTLRAVSHRLHIPVLLSLIALLFLLGCQSYRIGIPVSKPAGHYHFYLNPSKDLSCIGRVALVELDNDSSYPQISADITEALFQALQKRQVFGLTTVRQSDSAWRSLQLSLNDTYTLEQLLAIRKVLKCNAVLTGTITEFKPYPHMVVGLRLKLVDLMDGQLIWALEQIWDTADKTTEKRIKKYFQAQLSDGQAPLSEQLATISSLSFIKFVTYEVAVTI